MDRGSGPLPPGAAALPATGEASLQPSRHPQLSSPPEPVHLPGEVGRQLGGMDQEQGFIVLMSRRGTPVEGTCDHAAVVYHSQLIKPWVQKGCRRREVERCWRPEASSKANSGWIGCDGLAFRGLWSRPKGCSGGSFKETTVAEEEQRSDSDPGEGWG